MDNLLEKALEKYGAEILRLWVSASDYREDIRISDNILKQLSDAYRLYRCEAHRRALQEQGSTFEASQFLEQRQQVQAIWQRCLESG